MTKSGIRDQESGVRSKKLKARNTLAFCILLVATCICALFTVVTGCGKKGPPRPPQEIVPAK